MLRVTLRGLWARKRRLVSTCLAIALGTAFIVGTYLLSADLRDSVDSVVERTFDHYDAVVQSPDVQTAPFGQELRAPVAADVVDRVAGVDGVAEAAGVVESVSAHVFGHRGGLPNRRPPTLMVNWVGGPLQQGAIVRGRPPASDSEVVLDTKTATEVGFRLDGDVVLIGPDGRETFQLVGLLGVEGDASRSGRGPTVVVTTNVAQRHARLQGSYSYVAVGGEPGVGSDQLVERLGGEVPDLEALTSEQYVDQRADGFSWFADVISGFVAVFGFISLFVAAFIVHNTFSILVAQRTRENALMRALGAEPRQVLVATLTEAAVVGIVSSLLGLVAGVGLATVLKSFVGRFFSAESTSLAFPVSATFVALGVGVGITLLSAAVPAWRASRVPPVAAMADAELGGGAAPSSRGTLGLVAFLVAAVSIALALTDTAGPPLVFFAVGAAFLVVAASLLAPHVAAPASRLLALPFARAGSVTMKVAGENASRNPKRTAVAAVSLTIGVMLVSLIAVVASSVRSSVHDSIAGRVSADFVLRTSSFVSDLGVPAELLTEIRAMDSVSVASPVRVGGMRVIDGAGDSHDVGSAVGHGKPAAPPAGEDSAAVGIEPATFFDLVDPGAVDGSLLDLGDGTFAAVQRFADRRGWVVGDRVAFYFPRTGVQRLELVATVDTHFAQAAVLLPRVTFDRNMLPAFAHDAVVLVRAGDEASPAALSTLRADLRGVFAGYGTIAVEDVPQYVASRTAPLDTFLSAVYGLLGLAVVIALLGIANTLSLSILERRREMGVMRALGMTRGQLGRAVLGESTIIAVLGTLLGLALGLALSFALVKVLSADASDAIGWNPPVRLLAIVVGSAVLAGVSASVLPSWRASRSGALDAIGSV